MVKFRNQYFDSEAHALLHVLSNIRKHLCCEKAVGYPAGLAGGIELAYALTEKFIEGEMPLHYFKTQDNMNRFEMALTQWAGHLYWAVPQQESSASFSRGFQDAMEMIMDLVEEFTTFSEYADAPEQKGGEA